MNSNFINNVIWPLIIIGACGSASVGLLFLFVKEIKEIPHHHEKNGERIFLAIFGFIFGVVLGIVFIVLVVRAILAVCRPSTPDYESLAAGRSQIELVF